MLRGRYDARRLVPYEKLDWMPELPIFVISVDVLRAYGIDLAFDIEEHWRNSIEVLYTNESTNCVVVDGKEHVLGTDELFVINSRQAHFFPNVTSDYTGYTMQISYQFAKEVLPDLDEMSFEVAADNARYVLPIFCDMLTFYFDDERENADVIIALARAFLPG